MSEAAHASGRRRRRRRRWPWLVAALVALVVAYGVVSAFRLVRVDHELRSGVARVDAVKGQLHGAELTSGSLDAPVSAAAADFSAAAATMGSAWWAPIEVLPVVGRQLSSVRALSRAAASTTAAGSAALVQVGRLLAAPHATPAARTAVLDGLAGLTGSLDRRLTSISLGPRTDLVGPLATERDTFARDLGQVTSGLGRTAAASSAVAHMLEGPSTYLVVAANNAEMRDGSGMYLQAGTVSFSSGAARAGAFSDTAALTASQPPVPVSGDLAARWSALQPGKEWRNLGLSPQFPLNAPVAAAMWGARGGGPVDGVVSLDVAALSDLLGVTGPVTIASTTYTAQTVEQQLLVEQYAGLDSGGPGTNDARQAALGTLAAATLTSLERAGSSIGTLVDALASAANGRHLMVWSSDVGTESSWQAAGVSGAVPTDGLLVGLLNEGANKLDPFVTVRASLAARRHGADTDMTLTATVSNAAPTSLSRYAGDGDPGPRLAYNGALAVDLPSYAGDVSATGGAGYQTAGRDGTTDEVAVAVTGLLDGTSRTVTLHFTLLGGHGEMAVQPSARLPPVQWTWEPPAGAAAGAVAFDDGAAKALQW